MKKYRLKNMDCASCAAKIESRIRELEEVEFVSVNFAGSSMTIETGDIEKVNARIRQIEPEVDVEDEGNRRTVPVISTYELAENKRKVIKAVTGLLLLLAGIIYTKELQDTPFRIGAYAVYVAAYLVAGWGVLSGALRNIRRGQVFNEQFLMSVATLGAFAINEMPEAVAVMLFYIVGEFFQDIAVGRSRRSIKALLEIKPEVANLKTGNDVRRVSPEDISVGDLVLVRAGEKVPLDGIVVTGSSFVDAAALSGESVPRKIQEKDEVLAGMISQTGMLTIEVKKSFSESSVTKILEMVEQAAMKKAGTEKFITSFAKYYTPVVVFGALLIAILPPVVFAGATFSDWIYRALVVLVISCPCALVISIPLGYFGGVGRASKRGILVKGSNYLDALTRTGTVVFDKTGTLTEGEFKVRKVVSAAGTDEDRVLELAAMAESASNHPIARSILEAYGKAVDRSKLTSVKEIPGRGIKAHLGNQEVVAGNDRLLHDENIMHDACRVDGTVVHVAADRTYAGYIIIADRIKPGARDAVDKLKRRGITTVMLTGDGEAAAKAVAEVLKIDRYHAGLLPLDKVRHIETLLNHRRKVAFVGDGINDAPVIARADVGMAMGALGSDAAIETADVVLMADSPAQVADAMEVARKTRRIIWQNILFALGVKLIFITLGIAGIANMWEAVFGDMGVSLIAVFNAIRISR